MVGRWKRAWRREDGFTLIEVMITMGLLVTLTMTTAPFFLSSITSVGAQGQRQTAIQIAQGQMDKVRSYDPNTLLVGRTSSAVTAVEGSLALTALNAVGANLNYDPQATASSTPTVALTASSTHNGVTYTTSTAIDSCFTADGTTCVATQSAGTAAMYRVTVDVSWPRRAGSNCRSITASTSCDYQLSTLISHGSDPVFNPIKPVVNSVSPSPLHRGLATMLTITGSGFLTGDTVGSSGVSSGSASTVGSLTGCSVASATTITCALTATQTLGTYAVSVTDPSNQSSALNVPVTVSTPTIASVSPTTAKGNSSQTITVTGTDFYGTPSVSLSYVTGIWPLQSNATMPVSNVAVNAAGTTLTFTTTFFAAGCLGFCTQTYTPVKLVVTNADGGSATNSQSWSATP